MFLNSYYLIFNLLLIVLSLFTISLNSLFFTWLFIELNLILISPLLIMKNRRLKEQASLVLKYFLIQVVSSIILLIGIFLLRFDYVTISKLNLILIISLILKSGIPPFHFWFPPVVASRNPYQGFLVLCVQKIVPLFLLRILFTENLISFLIISSLVGGILGFNQNFLMKILAYSSIVHSRWLISGLLVDLLASYFYFILYCLIRGLILIIIFLNSIKTLSEILCSNRTYFFIISFLFSIFTLSGIPPFFGFFAKVYILVGLIKSNLFFISFFLIFGSILSFYYYFRLIVICITFNLQFFKPSLKNNYCFIFIFWILFLNLRFLFVL